MLLIVKNYCIHNHILNIKSIYQKRFRDNSIYKLQNSNQFLFKSNNVV